MGCDPSAFLRLADSLSAVESERRQHFELLFLAKPGVLVGEFCGLVRRDADDVLVPFVR